MTFKLLNRVRMSLLSAPGTGVLPVNTAAPGFQSFTDAGMLNGDTTPYIIEDGTPVGDVWEIGLGTWSTSGTLTRTSITETSNGNQVAISVSATAILSATLRGVDLSGVTELDELTDVTVSSPADDDLLTYNSGSNLWENKPAPTVNLNRATPTVVQYVAGAQSAQSAMVLSLGATPTPGNLLVLMANGGNANLLGSLVQGVAPVGFDHVDINPINISPACFEVSWAMRVVRASGDGQNWTVGTVGNSGSSMNAVLVEIAGADIDALNDLMIKRGVGATGTSFTDNAMSLDNALQLMFIGGGNGTLTVSNPSSCTFGPSTVNSGTLAFNHQVAGADSFDIAAAISSGVGAYPLLITVPGKI